MEAKNPIASSLDLLHQSLVMCCHQGVGAIVDPRCSGVDRAVSRHLIVSLFRDNQDGAVGPTPTRNLLSLRPTTAGRTERAPILLSTAIPRILARSLEVSAGLAS